MKIVLSLSEVDEILINHLCEKGKLEYGTETEVEWRLVSNTNNSYIIIEQ